MSSSQNPSTFEKKLAAMRAGFGQDFPASAQQVTFSGRTLTLAEVHQQLQEIEEVLTAVQRSHQSYRRAMADRRMRMGGFRAFYDEAALFVRQHFGRHSKRITVFGLSPPKQRRVLSAQALAIAKAKAAATRTLRGTKGKRQRAAITLAPQATLQVFGPDGKLLPGQEAVDGGSPPATEKAPDPSEGE